MRPATREILYIGIAWLLIVCYSIPLLSASESLIDPLPITDDTIKHVVIFLYALAIVSFLGGSQIPAVFLKKKSFVVQFTFSLVFGLILLLITLSSRPEMPLGSLNQALLKPFFSNYLLVAIEYLSIPYIVMIFLDLYLNGSLSAFSRSDFIQFLKGFLLHPRRTCEEISYRKTVLFSLVTIILVSSCWILRTMVTSSSGFVPTRWSIFPFNFWIQLDTIYRATLTLPAMLATWLLTSFLVHLIIGRWGGSCDKSRIVGVLGFAFIPSLMTIIVDIFEFGLLTENSPFMILVFFILSFLVPLLVWPLLLVAFAIRAMEEIHVLKAGFVGLIAFTPFFIMLSMVFL